LFNRALKRAEYLDNHLAETGNVIGPLHGIPVSVKDCVAIEGYTNTIGVAGWATKPATQSAILFEILEQQGAIVHVKTNIPLSMMVSVPCPWNLSVIVFKD
jgi:amidase